MDRLREIRPHKGGNKGLWQIHELDIIQKHHNPIVIGTAIHSVIHADIVNPAIRRLYPGLPAIPAFLAPLDTLYPLKEGAILHRIPARERGTPMDVNPQFTWEIALNEPGIVEAESLLRLIDDLIVSTRAACRNFPEIIGA